MFCYPPPSIFNPMAQQTAPQPALLEVPGYRPGQKALLVFFETDCPTCQLALPYLNALKNDAVQVIALSQDDANATRRFVEQMGIRYRAELDKGLKLSRAYDPQSVPTFYLLDESGKVERSLVGFDKAGLNELARSLGQPEIAPANDGAPAWKPGCSSRHLEPETAEAQHAAGSEVVEEAAAPLLRHVGQAAGLITLADEEDPVEYCFRQFGDGLPVVPPTEARVSALLRACDLSPTTVIGRIP
ncbi:MAG TPA: TlpA disulfide reductase family protein, partial [Terriglobales bacterium]|nr:TlpA disulfide reductase family protein [Terriglobales bacterium]